jgi:cyclophilin family peptidyl-prolyl cis-trans isomerase
LPYAAASARGNRAFATIGTDSDQPDRRDDKVRAPMVLLPSLRTQLPRSCAAWAFAALLLSTCFVGPAASAQSQPKVRVQTSMGSFVIELDSDRAPLTVANFLQYLRAGHYQGTIFHRVIANFVAQGGGYDEKFVEKPASTSVPNESGNGLSNRRGTIGLARTGEPHSGNSQFYINLADNPALDPQASRWGYAVFGHVVEGMDVVDGIGSVATSNGGPFETDVPVKPIMIEKIEELK